MMKPVYIIIEDGVECWVKEYSLKKFKKDLISITRYPISMESDPLNHKVIIVEEDGEYWFELIYEVREITIEQQ